MDDTYLVLTGMKVINKQRTFYFSEPGNWIDENGWPIRKKLHRHDGPAVETGDGHKYWYVDGKQHRTDGPACEWSNGSKWWWVNGKRLTEEKFNRWQEQYGRTSSIG